MEIIESLSQAVDVTMKTFVMLQYYLGSDTIDSTLSAFQKLLDFLLLHIPMYCSEARGRLRDNTMRVNTGSSVMGSTHCRTSCQTRHKIIAIWNYPINWHGSQVAIRRNETSRTFRCRRASRLTSYKKSPLSGFSISIAPLILETTIF